MGQGMMKRELRMPNREVGRVELRTPIRFPATSTFDLHPSNFVSHPGRLFSSTQISVGLGFLARNKNANAKRGFRDRRQRV